MPLLAALGKNGTDVAVLGAKVDVADTRFGSDPKGPGFVPLEGWCDHKYLVHTAGFSYSACERFRCSVFFFFLLSLLLPVASPTSRFSRCVSGELFR